jgi:hypothetical protein
MPCPSGCEDSGNCSVCQSREKGYKSSRARRQKDNGKYDSGSSEGIINNNNKNKNNDEDGVWPCGEGCYLRTDGKCYLDCDSEFEIDKNDDGTCECQHEITNGKDKNSYVCGKPMSSVTKVKFPWWGILLIVLGFVIIIVCTLVIVYIYYQKKKKIKKEEGVNVNELVNEEGKMTEKCCKEKEDGNNYNSDDSCNDFCVGGDGDNKDGIGNKKEGDCRRGGGGGGLINGSGDGKDREEGKRRGGGGSLINGSEDGKDGICRREEGRSRGGGGNLINGNGDGKDGICRREEGKRKGGGGKRKKGECNKKGEERKRSASEIGRGSNRKLKKNGNNNNNNNNI